MNGQYSDFSLSLKRFETSIRKLPEFVEEIDFELGKVEAGFPLHSFPQVCAGSVEKLRMEVERHEMEGDLRLRAFDHPEKDGFAILLKLGIQVVFHLCILDDFQR